MVVAFLMLGFILGLIDPVSRIAEKIASAYEAKQKAVTDQEKIRAEENIKTLEARRDVLIAESGQKINAFIRAGFALPFVIYNAKLVVWDKVLGLGATDGLSTELFQVEIACISFYFLYDIASRFKR
jgi:hypothetical protein